VPGGEGAGPALATVLAILGIEGGVVRHQVRSLGRLAILESATPFAVGTLLEVLLRREGDAWRAIVPPEGAVAERAPHRGESAPGRTAAPDRAQAARTGGGHDLPGPAAPPTISEASRAPPEALLRRFAELGIEPTPPLLRGAIRIAAAGTGSLLPPAGAPGSTPVGGSAAGTPQALAAALSQLLPRLAAASAPHGAPLAALSRDLRTLSEARLAPAERLLLPERVVRTLAAAVESLVAAEPRIAALRAAIAALLADGGRSELPASARALLGGAGSAGELPDGLTAPARARGVELLRAHEARAIAEHPALRALAAPLREVVEQAEAFAARSALERADLEPPARSGEHRGWVPAAGERPAVRVRWRRRAPAEGRRAHREGTRFRLATRWPGIGPVAVEGSIGDDEGAPEREVELSLAAELPDSRRAISAELPSLVASFAGSGLHATAAIAPWRAAAAGAALDGEGEGTGPDDRASPPEPLCGLDRRV